MIIHHSFTIACAAALLLTACAVPEQTGQYACFDAARIADLPTSLDEASGLALSRRDPGVIWAHNDSEGSPTLYALDRTGRMLGEMSVAGAGSQFDWEDIAAGPCPAGDCLYIADIGDNLHDRDDRAILRITEPHVDATTTTGLERFAIRYPHGALDAEALFVTPDTTVYIITKGRRHDISVYRYPPPLRPAERVTLEHVQQLSEGVAQVPDLVTGADASPDGQRVAVRTYSYLTLFRFDGDTLVPSSGRRFDLTGLAEPQGEAVAFAGGDTLLLATETGPARAQPFLSAVRCR